MLGRMADDLLPLVYAELRRLAAAQLAGEAPGQTLQPTALVHEAYLRVHSAPGDSPGAKNDRSAFLAAAATAMRRILIDRARAGRPKSAAATGSGPTSTQMTSPPRNGRPNYSRWTKP
jgi:DNA-directed RNA polymerase specialized sigma24 family protein